MTTSDIKMKRVTVAGALGVGRARIRQVQVLVSNVGPGRLTITDGSGGPVVLDLDFAADLSHVADIPDLGILVASDPVISVATNITAATVYYA